MMSMLVRGSLERTSDWQRRDWLGWLARDLGECAGSDGMGYGVSWKVTRVWEGWHIPAAVLQG